MQIGKNQTFVRDENLALFFGEFARGSFSRVHVAQKYNISKTAASNIVASLCDLNLIRANGGKYPKKREAPGVKPVLYSLNPDFGIVVILDMSTPEVVVSVCDFLGNVLWESKFPDREVIVKEDFEYFCQTIEATLQSEQFESKKLAKICVALPCAVDSVNERIFWSPRFDFGQEGFDIYEFLMHRMNTTSIILNDMGLLIRGEVCDGLISEGVNYALMVYVDSGIGGALYINDRHEAGMHGLAGEIGHFPVAKSNSQIVKLDEIASINGIKNEIRERLKGGGKSVLSELADKLRFRHIVEAYNGGDTLTIDVVEESARTLGASIKTILRMLNIPFVVISGRIRQLGKEYLDLVKKTIDTDMFFCAEVVYSELNDGIIRGAISTTQEKIFEETTRAKKKERNSRR